MLWGSASTVLAAPSHKIQCHLLYGGEEKVIDVMPTESIYEEPLNTFGGFFSFKIVREKSKSDKQILKFYTYARDEGLNTLIHQGSYLIPLKSKSLKFGFTGLNSVYEPSTQAELQYWCQ